MSGQTSPYTYSIADPIQVNCEGVYLQLQVSGPAGKDGTFLSGPTSFYVSIPVGPGPGNVASSLGTGFPEQSLYTFSLEVPQAAGGTVPMTSTWKAGTPTKTYGSDSQSESDPNFLVSIEFSTEGDGIPTGCSPVFSIGPFTSNAAPNGAALSVGTAEQLDTVAVPTTKAMAIGAFTPSNPQPALCEQITLNWTVTGGTSVRLEGGESQKLTGTSPHAGSFNVLISPAVMMSASMTDACVEPPSCPIGGAQPVQEYANLTDQKTFTLILEDENNNTLSQDTTISLTPVAASLTVTPSTVNWGESATVTWSVEKSDGVWNITTPDQKVLAASPQSGLKGSIEVTPSDYQASLGSGTQNDEYTVPLILKAGGYNAADIQVPVVIRPVSLSDLKANAESPVSADQDITLSWTAGSAKSLTLTVNDYQIDVTGKDSYTFKPGQFCGTSTTVWFSLSAEGVSGTSVRLPSQSLEVQPVKILKCTLSTLSPGKVIGVYSESINGTQTVPFPNQIKVEWSAQSATKVTISGPQLEPHVLSPSSQGEYTFTSAQLFPEGAQLGNTYIVTAEGPDGPAEQIISLDTEGTSPQTLLLGPAYVYDGGVQTCMPPFCGLINPPEYYANQPALTYNRSGTPEESGWAIQALGVSYPASLAPLEKDLPLRAFNVHVEKETTTITFPFEIEGLTVSYPFGSPSGTCEIQGQSIVFRDVTEPFIFQMNAPGSSGLCWYAAPG